MPKHTRCRVEFWIYYRSGSLIFEGFNATEEAVPTDTVFVVAHPNKPGFTYYMVFGNEAPEARIEGVVAVIAHEPIVIHAEGVGCCFFSVDTKRELAFIEFVAFIFGNKGSIEGDIFAS